LNHLTIENPRVKYDPAHNRWHVLHPSNDSILAYCGTQSGADFVKALINDIAKTLKEDEEIGIDNKQ